MLHDAPVEIIGDTDIQCAVTVGRQDVHPLSMLAQHVWPWVPGLASLARDDKCWVSARLRLKSSPQDVA
jgi:hypothetical protein